MNTDYAIQRSQIGALDDIDDVMTRYRRRMRYVDGYVVLARDAEGFVYCVSGVAQHAGAEVACGRLQIIGTYTRRAPPAWVRADLECEAEVMT